MSELGPNFGDNILDADGLDTQPVTSGEVRLKSPDEVARILNERFQDNQECSILTQPRFAERYIKEGLNIVIRFSVGTPPVEFFARLYKACRGDIGNNVVGTIADIEKSKDSPGETEIAMLVNVVETVQYPEPVTSALVRLYSVDSFLSTLGDTTYFSLTHGIVFVRCHRDGKLNLQKLFLAKRPIGVVDHDKPVNEVIEGAPGVVQDIADETEDRRRQIGLLAQAKDFVSGIRIKLFDNKIDLGFSRDSTALTDQIIEMLIGPI